MEKQVKIRGRKITYYEEGEGFPILMIHGWSPRAIDEFFELQLLLAERGYRTILLNLPGFGSRWLPFYKWEMAQYIQCIIDFIDLLGLEKLFLLGHSLGGTIAIRLAAEHSQKVRNLILLSPGVVPGLEFRVWGWHLFSIILYAWLTVLRIVEFILYVPFIIFKKITFFIARFIKVGGIVERISRSLKLLKTRYGLVKILNRIVRGADTLRYLSEIHCSTLVVWGEKDYNFDFPFMGSARFMGRIPDYIFKIIPEARHNFQRDNPQETAEMIVDFIKKVTLS